MREEWLHCFSDPAGGRCPRKKCRGLISQLSFFARTTNSGGIEVTSSKCFLSIPRKHPTSSRPSVTRAYSAQSRHSHGNGKQIELLDHSKLIEELRRLERRPGRTGKDGFDHPPRLSDDIANSVAGVSWLLKRRGQRR